MSATLGARRDKADKARQAHESKVLHLLKRQVAWAAPLMPCPFCGSEAVLTQHTTERIGVIVYRHYAICSNMRCGCSLVFSFTPQEAVKAWNRRVVRLVARLPVQQCCST